MTDTKDIVQLIRNQFRQTFQNNRDIYNELNKKGIRVTHRDVDEALKDEMIKNVFNKKIDEKQFQQKISAPQHHYQADILFLNKIKNFIGLLTIIDINTRYAHAFILTSKSANQIVEQLQKFINQEDVKGITFDDGSEFNNSHVKNLLQENQIRYIFFNKDQSPHAQMIVERFNRTIREKLQYFMTLNKTRDWTQQFQSFIDVYNRSMHQGIKQSPQKAKENNFHDVQKLFQKVDTQQLIINKFHIGDYIRLKKQDDERLFKKGRKTYSKNIYQIINQEGNHFICQKMGSQKQVTASASQMLIVKQLPQRMEIKINNNQAIERDKEKEQEKINRRLKRELKQLS